MSFCMQHIYGYLRTAHSKIPPGAYRDVPSGVAQFRCFPYEKGIAISQKKLWLFSNVQIIGLALFWPYFGTVCFIIEIFIRKPAT